MNCEQVKAHLVDYLYGELPPDQAREVEDALDRCPDCAAELADLREVHEGVAAMPRLDVPAPIHHNILRQARLAADVYTAEKKRTGINWSAIFSPPALASALVLMMVVGVSIMLTNRGALHQDGQAPGVVSESNELAEAPPESVVAAVTDEEADEEESELGRTGTGRFGDNERGSGSAPRTPVLETPRPDPTEPNPTELERIGVRGGATGAPAGRDLDRRLEPADAVAQQSDQGGADEPIADPEPTTPDLPEAAREQLAAAERQEEAERAERDARNRESDRAEARERDRSAADRSSRSRRSSDPAPSLEDALTATTPEEPEVAEEAPRVPSQEAPEDDWSGNLDRAAEIAQSDAEDNNYQYPDGEAYEAEVYADDGRAAGEMVETTSPEPTEWTGEQSITLLGGDDDNDAPAAQSAPPTMVPGGETATVTESRSTTATPTPTAGVAGPQPDDGTEELAYGYGQSETGLLEDADESLAEQSGDEFLPPADPMAWAVELEEGEMAAGGAGGAGAEISLDGDGSVAAAEPAPEAEPEPAGDTVATADLDQLYNEGMSRYNDGSYREAIEYFDLLMQNAPHTSDFYDLSNFYQGQANVSMGNWRDAAGNFEQIDDPGFEHFEEARLLLAQSYENSGQLERAEGLYNELLTSTNAVTNVMADEGLERIQRRRADNASGDRPSRSMREGEEVYDSMDEAAPAAVPAESAEKAQSY